jgi:hypothetical protein
MPIDMPDIPATTDPAVFGFYDLTSGAWYFAGVYNEKAEQYKITPPWPDRLFTGDAMAAEGIR